MENKTLLIISQNMAGELLPEGSQYKIEGTPAIVVVCTQEENGTGTTILKESLESYTLKDAITINEGHPALDSADKNVIMRIYGLPSAWTLLEKGFVPIASKESGIKGMLERGLRSFVTYKKGATWIQVARSNGDSLLFINLHLPMLGKDNDTLGNEYRIKIFKEILSKLTPQITKATSVFITGDLNFRIESDGHNQLNTLLRSELTQFKDITPRNYTCSFKKNTTSECRLQSVNTPLTNTSCFHEKPLRKSRCDRMLVSIKPTQLALKKIKTFVMNPDLDHNGLSATFFLSASSPAAFANSSTAPTTTAAAAVLRRAASYNRRNISPASSRYSSPAPSAASSPAPSAASSPVPSPVPSSVPSPVPSPVPLPVPSSVPSPVPSPVPFAANGNYVFYKNPLVKPIPKPSATRKLMRSRKRRNTRKRI